MRTIDATRTLQALAKRGRSVYTTGDLARVFCEPRTEPRLNGTLVRLVAEGVLVRACRGVYVYADDPGTEVLHAVAAAARRGYACAESYETALSKWGDISQVYPRLLTVATTGRQGRIECPWGDIELIHVSMDEAALRSVSAPRDGMLPITDRRTSLALSRRARRRALALADDLEEEL